MNNMLFQNVAATQDNPNWEKYIYRQNPLYSREDDIRSPFARDYTRVLHSMAYRRLKHKTQVFFNIDNDHISPYIGNFVGHFYYAPFPSYSFIFPRHVKSFNGYRYISRL